MFKRGQPDTLQTGMGRPVSKESLDEVVSGVTQLLPKTVELRRRRLPGITYMDGIQWRARHMPGRYDGAASEERARGAIEAQIKAMCKRGIVVPETVEQGVTLNVDVSHIKKISPRMFRFGIDLWDIPDDHYPEGFWIQGERYAIERYQGIKNRPSQREVPAHFATLASFVLSGAALLPSRQELQEVLPGQVSVGRLGIIRPE